MTSNPKMLAGGAVSRSMTVDFLKAVASQFIVLHHLVAYGPLSEQVRKAAPRYIDWMYDYGRWAPQVFLVIAGFLVARGCAPSGVWTGGTLWQAVKNRYLRLILPYIAALILAVVVAAIVRPWLVGDMTPPPPTWQQWAAHLLLAQNLMNYDALSAGVWYIAIDFQLFVMMTMLLWVGKLSLASSSRWKFLPLTLIGIGMSASLLFFNRHDSLNDYAIYFFGTYSLGAVAYWLGQAPLRKAYGWLLAVAFLVVIALMLEFRGRLVLASIVALMLFCQQRHFWHGRWFFQKQITLLGKISYALFLVHFPILLLANMVCVRWDIHRHGSSTACATAAWLTSIGVAWLFHRWVEVPCAKLGRRSVAE